MMLLLEIDVLELQDFDFHMTDTSVPLTSSSNGYQLQKTMSLPLTQFFTTAPVASGAS